MEVSAEEDSDEDSVVRSADAEPEVDADSDSDSDAVVGGSVDVDSDADDESEDCDDGEDGEEEDDEGEEEDDEGEEEDEGDEGDEEDDDGEDGEHVPCEPLGSETHGDGELGVGELGVGDEMLTDGVGGCAGGFVWWSRWPVSPLCRAIHTSWSRSKMTNTLMMVVEGATTTTFCVRYDGHESPVGLGVVCCATGPSSGLPHAQRTRGTPRESTRTAVPAWRTA